MIPMQRGKGIWVVAEAIYCRCGTHEFTFTNVADVISNTALLKKLRDHGKLRRLFRDGKSHYVLTAEAVEELAGDVAPGGGKRRRRRTTGTEYRVKR